MAEVLEKQAKPKGQTKTSRKKIPEFLIYEMMDGKPIYYRGYQEVMKGLKKREEIMGQSDLQMIIVGCLTKFLNKNLDEQKYFASAGETGLHLDKKDNFSADVVVFAKSDLQKNQPQGKYLSIAPLVVLEVDIQADAKDLEMNEIAYYSNKTQKLLDFGVQEVFWFFTSAKKVMYARAQQDWIWSDWNKELTLLQEHQFSLAELLKKEGWEL
ncbi:MAG: Uma2 family endonuclease [Microscillaceae bacterium]|jgi:Uma2 family endonuclease|nr:Uma2 family endonuclease [Microscillaceae bacterium]